MQLLSTSANALPCYPVGTGSKPWICSPENVLGARVHQAPLSQHPSMEVAEVTRSRRTSGLLFSRRSSVGTWEALEAHAFTQCQVRAPPQCIIYACFKDFEELIVSSVRALEIIAWSVTFCPSLPRETRTEADERIQKVTMHLGRTSLQRSLKDSPKV